MPDHYEKDTEKGMTRRSFAVGAAVVATAAFIPAGKVLGQSEPPKPATSPAAVQPQTDAMAKLSPASRAEVEMKVNEIFRKYGSRLSEEQKADIRKVVAEGQEGLERMRKFALENGDQPSNVLQLMEREER